MQTSDKLVLELNPAEDLDLTLEHEKELIEQSRIPVLQSGFRSLREFQIATMEALIVSKTTTETRGGKGKAK